MFPFDVIGSTSATHYRPLLEDMLALEVLPGLTTHTFITSILCNTTSLNPSISRVGVFGKPGTVH